MILKHPAPSLTINDTFVCKVKKYVQGYITPCSRLIKKFPSANIYISTVTSVDERYTYLTISNIRSFNEELQAAFGTQIINAYHYLNKIGHKTIDGIHYDEKTAAKELNYILDAL